MWKRMWIKYHDWRISIWNYRKNTAQKNIERHVDCAEELEANDETT